MATWNPWDQSSRSIDAATLAWLNQNGPALMAQTDGDGPIRGGYRYKVAFEPEWIAQTVGTGDASEDRRVANPRAGQVAGISRIAVDGGGNRVGNDWESYNPDGNYQHSYINDEEQRGSTKVLNAVAKIAGAYMAGSGIAEWLGGAGGAGGAGADAVAGEALLGGAGADVAATAASSGAGGLSGAEAAMLMGGEAAGGGAAGYAGTSLAGSGIMPSSGYGPGMTGLQTSTFDTLLPITGNNALTAGVANAAGPVGNALSGLGGTDSLIRYGLPLVSSGLQAYGTSRAADAQIDASRESNALLKSMYDQNVERNAPFVSGGVAGFQALLDRLGLSGNTGAAGYGTIGKVPTASEVMAEPGYQFGLDQGLRAQDARLNARGMTGSGAALKAATRYGTDYAAGQYGAAFDRGQRAQTNAYNQLMGVTNVGQSAANNTAAMGSQYADRAGSNIIGAGNASAANSIGQANALAGAINQGVSMYNQGQNDQQLLEMLRQIRGG